MTRATEVFTTAAIVIGLYLAMVLQLIPLPQKIQDEIVPVVSAFHATPCRCRL
jgi:dolichyl-phosphate mannosyltransferase polypeptide 3